MTSNDVESVNSALKGIRCLPIIDCLLEIERYVACKWDENAQKVRRWRELTPYASRKVDKLIVLNYLGGFDECSQSCFIVAIPTGFGNLTAKFSVQILANVVRYSCV